VKVCWCVGAGGGLVFGGGGGGVAFVVEVVLSWGLFALSLQLFLMLNFLVGSKKLLNLLSMPSTVLRAQPSKTRIFPLILFLPQFLEPLSRLRRFLLSFV